MPIQHLLLQGEREEFNIQDFQGLPTKLFSIKPDLGY
jgi:hypothetical protein